MNVTLQELFENHIDSTDAANKVWLEKISSHLISEGEFSLKILAENGEKLAIRTSCGDIGEGKNLEEAVMDALGIFGGKI